MKRLQYLRFGIFFSVLAALGAGCGGGSHATTGGLVFGDLTVQGTVQSYIGAAFPNVAVWIAGRGPFITNGAGQFVVDQVPVPYRAIVVDGSTGDVDVWDGLTRSDPVLTSTNVSSTAMPLSASTSGTVTDGIGWPVPGTHETEVHAKFDRAFGLDSTDANATTGAYALPDLEWFGSFSPTLHLVAMQYAVDADGNATDYTGWAMHTVGIQFGSTLVNQDLALLPVPTTTLSGTLDHPPGIFPVRVTAYARLPSGAFIELPSETRLSDTFSLREPVVTGVSHGLLVMAADSTLQQLSFVIQDDLPAPATNLTLSVPVPTGLVLPIEGALGVSYHTPFLITQQAQGRAFHVSFRPVAGPGHTINLHTVASTFTIPDLSEMGMGLQVGTEYEWQVVANGPVGSLDAAAVATALQVLFIPFLNSENGSFTTASTSRTFTFSP